MRTLLPGKPNACIQAIDTATWSARSISAYITGNAIAILSGPQKIIQTIYDSDESRFCAIEINEATGRIAACTNSTIRIYAPDSNVAWISPHWTLESSIKLDETSDRHILSWGASNELLTGSKTLRLYSTGSETRLLWQTDLPHPVQIANISHDSSYIVATSPFDNLLKVWRRISFGSRETRFDLTYVAHPAPVTGFQWRKPTHPEQSTEHVLFTFCVDLHIRVWIPNEGTQHQLKKWGTIDLRACLNDRPLPGAPLPIGRRYAFIISGRDLRAGVEYEVAESSKDNKSMTVALRDLITLANKSPELLVVLNGEGSVKILGFQDITYRTRGHEPVFVAVEGQSRSLFFPMLREGNYLQARSFFDTTSGKFQVLFHYLDRRIDIFAAPLSALVRSASDSPNLPRLTEVGTWDGHSLAIKKIVRNYSGRAIVSRSSDGECFVWSHGSKKKPLLRQSVIPSTGRIHRICVIRRGKFVVLLRDNEISLWDCRQIKANLLSSEQIGLDGNPLCLVNLPRRDVKDYSTAHIATVTPDANGKVWEISLPRYQEATSEILDRPLGSIREFCTFRLDGVEGLSYVLPVDPAGEQPVMNQFLDSFSRDVAISYTNTGIVTFWTARVHPTDDSVDWLSTASSETGIENPALVSGSSFKRAALANSLRTQLTIWDVRTGRLEYDVKIQKPDTIQDLDWTSTPDKQSILSVGYQNRVILLSQSRFDYLNQGPAWAPIREINIEDVSSYPVGDSTWLGDGSLVIGAGHQLFIYDRQVELSESRVNELKLPQRTTSTWDLFDVVQRLNGPLPVFHPQFLSQCILTGKISIVQKILIELNKTLKYHVEEETISNYLGIPLEEFHSGQRFETTRAKGDHVGFSCDSSDDHDDVFDEETALAIIEKLTTVKLPQLSSHEQIQLANIVECCGMVEKQRRSLDENGARFLLFFRQHVLRKGRTNEIQMSWREINWAFHSTSQDILSDFVDRQYHSKMVWDDARETGIFMWLADAAAVKRRFEQMARNEYTKNDDKNPVDCSIFYLALKRKNILQGLWRVANGNQEQAATQRILTNNFEDPKWRTIALKNAYALLSKRRFQYAAAWFLLANSLQEAVNVCLKQLKDLQLGIAIARVHGGDDSPVFHKLLEEQVLPLAAEDGNRWLASWAFWMLGRKDMAVRAFISPVYTLLETPLSPDYKSRIFLADDPSLIVLYNQLRQKTLQTLRGAAKVTPEAEWQFILHSANLYSRMGCDLLALDLVCNWEFLKVPTRQDISILGGEINPLQLLRKRRSSLVVDDIPMHLLNMGGSNGSRNGNVQSRGIGGFGIQTGGHEKPKAKPPPTMFHEPDANSLLDSFGF